MSQTLGGAVPSTRWPPRDPPAPSAPPGRRCPANRYLTVTVSLLASASIGPLPLQRPAQRSDSVASGDVHRHCATALVPLADGTQVSDTGHPAVADPPARDDLAVRWVHGSDAAQRSRKPAGAGL